MKKFFLILICFVSVFSLFAQEEVFDDFDSLFENASDLEETVINEDANQISPINQVTQKVGITLSGNLTADIGYGFWVKDDEATGERIFDQSGYLSFVNHTYLSAKPTQNIYVFSDFLIKLVNVNPSIEIYQMYFNYNLWNTFYVSVGKKDINWGAFKLFDSNTVLGPARSSTILGSVNLPLGIWDFTAIGMLNGSVPDNSDVKFIDQNISTDISKADLSYAFKSDLILFDVLFSLQFHQYHESKTDFPSIAGLEIKKTIFGFDCYLHSDIGIKFSGDMGKDSFNRLTNMAGFYRKWAEPDMGINVEFRHKYNFTDDANSFELGEEWGWDGFFDNHVCFVFKGYHNFTNGTGNFTPGFILKNIFPDAKLNTGVTFDYTADSLLWKFGTTLNLNIDY